MKVDYEIALSNFSWFNHPIEVGIQKTAELGYKGIDINVNRPQALPRDLTDQEVKEIGDAIEENGLECAAVTPFNGSYDWCLSTPNKVIYEDTIQHIKNAMDLAHQWGAKRCETVTGPPRIVEDDQRDSWKRIREALNELVDYAADYDIVIGLEYKRSPQNRRSYRVEKLDDALQMVDEVDSKNLGVLIDVNHAALDPYMTVPEQIDMAADKLVHMHLSDSPLGIHKHLPIGEGKIKWKFLLKKLADVGYDGWMSLEMEEVQDPYSSSYDSLRALKGYIREIEEEE